MKLKLFLILMLSLSLYAQNLAEIIDSLSSSKKAKSIKDKSYSEIASSESSLSYAAPELGLSVAHAEDSVDDGLEYAVGISQNISQPFSSADKSKATTSMSNSIAQEAKHKLHILRLQTASLYHDACISKEVKEKATLLYDEQLKRFGQFQKAYDLGEISRNSLLLNKLELAKLKQKISAYKRAYLIELSSLEAVVDNLTIESVECSDMFEITPVVKLIATEQHAEVQRVEFEKDSSKASYKLHDALFQSVGYELAYEQELDTTRYSFAINLPISALTDTNEKNRAEYLHLNSALSAEKDALVQEIRSASNSLQLKLGTLYDEYILVKEEILPLNKELLRLSKSALAEGEGSVMEYLYVSRSYSEYMIEVLQIKKNYYNTLFELYKKADLDLGEDYAQ